jgi:hypothetical protein
MKLILRSVVFGAGLALTLVDLVPPGLLPSEIVPPAHAIFGVRRRSFAMGMIVGENAAMHQAGAGGQQQAAPPPAAPPAAAPTVPPPPPAPPPPAATGQSLPLGTVVAALPPGCTSTPVGGVEYYYCAGNFYRAVFQGNQLVYVTAKP